MTSKLTRERLQEIAEDGFLKHGESKELARMALAAMDSEPVALQPELAKVIYHFRDWNEGFPVERFKADYVISWMLANYPPAPPAPVVSADLLHTAASAIEDLLTTKDRTGAGVWFDLPFRLRSAANAQPAPEKYNIGDATMRHIFTPTGMTNVSDMQAVFDRVEAVLVGMDQPAPVVPDGYVMVPMRLTAENGAKGALSGEFSETKFVNCPECFGDEECETCDGSGKIEITVPVTWTTIKAIWVKGVEHFAATAQENN